MGNLRCVKFVNPCMLNLFSEQGDPDIVVRSRDLIVPNILVR